MQAPEANHASQPQGPTPTPPRPVTPAGILAASLERLVRRLDDGFDPGFAAELRAASELASGLDPYLVRCTTPESADLRSLAERTHAEDWQRYGIDTGLVLEQEMLSGHVEGRLLQMIVHAVRARRVLEIGMFTGYSALAMAEALPGDGLLVACEIDADVAAFATRCFEKSASGKKIDVRVGPAMATLADLATAGERFDLVFIDADKAGYGDYLSTVLETDLLTPNGLVCVDNTLMQGQPWTSTAPTANGTAIAAFNDRVAADPRLEQVLLPLRDGLTLIRRAHEA